MVMDVSVSRYSRVLARPAWNMPSKRGSNRSLLAMAAGEFRRQLTYKCAWYGS